jgi:hypothetical protein
MNESKFVVGSFWRARNGSKWRVIANDMDCQCPIAAHEVGGTPIFLFFPDGLAGSGTIMTENDLMEPWTELVKTFRLWAWLRMRDNGTDGFVQHGTVMFFREDQRVDTDFWERAPWLDEPEAKP